VRGERRGEPARELGADLRVHDVVQAQPRGLVREHDRAERLAVERTGGVEDPRAERGRELGDHRHALRLQLVHDRVGVDHDRAALGEHARDRALARADPPGQSDHDGHRRGCYALAASSSCGRSSSCTTTQFLPSAFAR
jgi:hypothetical protein